MADLRESAGLQQVELVGFFPVDGPFSTTTASSFRFPQWFQRVAKSNCGSRGRLLSHAASISCSGTGLVSTLQNLFPGMNFIRLPIYDYASPDALATYVNQLTSA